MEKRVTGERCRHLGRGCSVIALTLGMLIPASLPSQALAAEKTSADVERLLLELRQTIEAQEKKIAEQEERLAEAERRLAKREEESAGQQRQLEGLSYQLGALSAYWLDEYGSLTFTPGRAIENAVYQTYGGSLYLAQTSPQAPKPLAPQAPQPLPPSEIAPGEGPAPSGPGVEEERPESEKTADEVLVEAGGVLLPPGTLQIEPSLEYTHVSTDRVAISGFTIFEAIVIGLIRVDDIERDTLTAALGVRYGLFDRFQLEARVPYIYRNDTEILGVGTANQSELTIEGHDIGDFEIGGAYQILKQQGYIPGTVLRLTMRLPTGQSAFDIERQTVDVAGREQERLAEAPTGSGFYAVVPSATFIWALDPVAFFTGGSYTINIARDQGDFGNIDPGDTIEFFAGMNVALSDRVGINLSFVDQITLRTTVEGVEQIGSDVNDARIALGTSVGLSPSMSLLATASAGLTDESPDFSFVVSLPINISLF